MTAGSQLGRELLRIIEAITVLSPAAFRFAGRPSGDLTVPLTGLALTPEMPPLMSELVSKLYEHCFSNRFAGSLPDASPRPPLEKDAAWLDRLSRANQSRERWEDGWQVLQPMSNGQLLANRGESTRLLGPGEFVNLTGSGAFLQPGMEVRVFVPRESLTMQPGYYYAFGETTKDSSGQSPVVRFYWHTTVEGAPTLLRLLTAALNRWAVPFRFKTGAAAEMLARTDSGVLYIPRRYAQVATELALDLRLQVAESLPPAVPLFTLELAPGLAFAEDPGTQESFGMSRCRMLAQGIWSAHLQGACSAEERLAVVEREFLSEGISLERPWLNSARPAGLAPALLGEVAA